MILFCFPQYEHMAQQIRTLPFLESGKFAVLRYNNQELHAVVASSVSEKPCSIL